MKILAKFVVCFALLALAFANFNLPANKNYPGGIALVQLNTSKQTPPKVFFKNHRVLVQSNNGKWYAIVGIPLSATVGKHNLKLVKNSGKVVMKPFPVIARNYPLRHITIKDASKVTPNPTQAKKIHLQKQQAQKIFNTWTNKQKVPTHFILPCKGWFSSYFGIRRIYNKTHHARHTGLDIAQLAGKPVHAAANGTVLAVKDYVLTGNTIFINHGQGLITVYAHLSKVDVHDGEKVTQGELIGKIGATGRVTGAHLHWEVILNGAKVNPTLFL